MGKLKQRLTQMALELGMGLLLEQCLPQYASLSHKKFARTELLKLQEKFATQNMMRQLTLQLLSTVRQPLLQSVSKPAPKLDTVPILLDLTPRLSQLELLDLLELLVLLVWLAQEFLLAMVVLLMEREKLMLTLKLMLVSMVMAPMG